MLRWHLWRSRSSSARTRGAAAVRLGRYPDREAIRRLIELLKDSSAMVRESAAGALRGTRDPEALEPLIDALRNGEMAAVETLCRMRDPRAIQVLVETLPRARIIAFQALEKNFPGWRQSQEARLAAPALIAAWEKGEKGQRLEAANWLGTFRDTRAISPLVRALAAEELDYDLRPAVLRALESIDAEWVRREEAVSAVPRLASAACWSDCEGSKRALRGIGRVAPQALVEALCHDDWRVRHGAQAALSDILSPDAAAPLLATLRKREAADFAAGALLKLLKSAATQIGSEDLQGLVKLTNLPGIHWELKYACNVGAVDSTGSEVEVDCGRLRQLARMELHRRGEEAV